MKNTVLFHEELKSKDELMLSQYQQEIKMCHNHQTSFSSASSQQTVKQSHHVVVTIQDTYESERSSTLNENNDRKYQGGNSYTIQKTSKFENIQKQVQQHKRQPTSQIQSVKIHQFLELNMRSQNLQQVNETLLRKNQFLRQLDLRNNQIKLLPEAAICSLSVLQKLRIDNNLLVQLPQDIGKLEKLEALTASNNFIVKLPSSLFKLSETLAILALNDNRIRKLPSSVGHLRSLKVLLLHNNFLKSLPTELAYVGIDLQEFSIEWFQYLEPPVHKILKLDKSHDILKNFMRFLQYVRDLTPRSKGCVQATFIQFMGYFMKYSNPKEITQKTQYHPKGRSVMHYIALNGHVHLFVNVVKSLPMTSSEETNYLNVTDEDGTTPLHLALKSKQNLFVHYLLRKYQNSLNVTHCSKKYGLPLIQALKNHDLPIIELLLSYYSHIDINLCDNDGNNPMHVLMGHFMSSGDHPAAANSKDMSRIALVMIRKLGININALNNQELSPLHVAIKSFQHKALKFCLDYNLSCLQKGKIQLFDLNIKSPKNGWTPLHYAVYVSNFAAVNLLIKFVYIALSKGLHVKHCGLLNYITTRDNDFRLAQELCPYNSPFAKILHQCQSTLLKSGTALTLSSYTNIEHSNIKRANMKKPKQYQRKHTEPTPQIANYQMALKRVNSSVVLTQRQSVNARMKERYQGVNVRNNNQNSNNNRSVDRIQSGSNNMKSSISSRTHLNSVMHSDSISGSFWPSQSINQSPDQLSSRHGYHSNTKHSPRLQPPLPPKKLLFMPAQAYHPKNVEDEEEELGGPDQQLLEMEELIKSVENTQKAEEFDDDERRFMSHSVNFDTDAFQATNKQEGTSGMTAARNLFNKSIDRERIYLYQSSSSSEEEGEEQYYSYSRSSIKRSQEERKSLIDLYSSARPKTTADLQHYMFNMDSQYQSAPNSIKPQPIPNSDHELANLTMTNGFQSVSTEKVVTKDGRVTRHLKKAIREFKQGNLQGLQQQETICQFSRPTDTHHNYKQRLNQEQTSSDEETICNAGDDEPEAGSMGQMIGNKINKFENNEVSKSTSSRYMNKEGLQKFMQELDDIARENQVIKLDLDPKQFYQSNQVLKNFRSREGQSKLSYIFQGQIQPIMSNGPRDEEFYDEEGNVFDTVNFRQVNSIPQSQIQSVTQSDINCSNMSKLVILKASSVHIAKKRKASQYLLDVKLNTENNSDLVPLVELTTSEIIQCKEHSQKFRKLYWVFCKIQNVRKDDESLLQLVNNLSQTGDQIVLRDLWYLLSITDSKTVIPVIEDLLLNNKRQKYELENTLNILLLKAKIQSQRIMEEVNLNIKTARERSKERLQQRRQQHAAFEILDSDISPKQSTLINHKSPSQRLVDNQNCGSTTTSANQVPEFIARLQKSPSTQSLTNIKRPQRYDTFYQHPQFQLMSSSSSTKQFINNSSSYQHQKSSFFGGNNANSFTEQIVGFQQSKVVNNRQTYTPRTTIVATYKEGSSVPTFHKPAGPHSSENNNKLQQQRRSPNLSSCRSPIQRMGPNIPDYRQHQPKNSPQKYFNLPVTKDQGVKVEQILLQTQFNGSSPELQLDSNIKQQLPIVKVNLFKELSGPQSPSFNSQIHSPQIQTNSKQMKDEMKEVKSIANYYRNPFRNSGNVVSHNVRK